MKFNTFIFSLLIAFSFSACNDNPDDGPSLPEYNVTIQSPNTSEVNSGESIHLHVDFDEPNELTVHHVNIQLVTDSGEIIYDNPSVAHVHVDGGHHEHHDDIVLNLEAGTEVTLTAKVWGHTDGLAEQSASATFVVQ